MELRHLRCFIAVAEELSFRRAAERVHVDQTPLSRTIRDLEHRLGVQLLVRGPRSLLLTPAGVRLLEEARKVFVRIDHARRVVRATDALHHAPLRIGVADDISQPKLSECLARWAEHQPHVPLEIAEMRADELAAALRRHEVDAGFSFGLPNDAALAQEPAWSYPLMALLPADHELSSVGTVAITDVLSSPLISYCADRQCGLQQQMQAIVDRHSKAVTLSGKAGTLPGYVMRVATGVGVGLSDAGHAATLRRSDVVAVPLRERESITTWVLHKRHRFGQLDALQRFVAHVKSLR